MPAIPRTLRQLLEGEGHQSEEFCKNIRHYNAALAFTSLGVKIDESVLRGTGRYCFCIQGQLHHSTGALLPENEVAPVYAQLYIHDPEEAAEEHW